VKPANVLLTAEGAPLLADFNVGYSSKLAGVSPTTFFGGSLAYMPPEQIEAFDPGHPRRAEEVDGRADLYALGVTLWELLVGERPFAAGAPPGLRVLDELAARRRAGLSGDSSTRLPPGTPRGLFGVLRTCLAPKPEDRYATADELARQLELCRRPRTR